DHDDRGGQREAFQGLAQSRQPFGQPRRLIAGRDDYLQCYRPLLRSKRGGERFRVAIRSVRGHGGTSSLEAQRRPSLGPTRDDGQFGCQRSPYWTTSAVMWFVECDCVATVVTAAP